MKKIVVGVMGFLMLAASACGAWFALDGYEARWAERPRVEGARRWTHNGADVYEVDGHFYREHQGRWAEYRERPRELQERR